MGAALIVVLCWLVPVGAWVALLLVDRGWSRVVWAVFGAFVVWQLLPRPLRVRPEAVPVPEAEAPGLYALVSTVAGAVEVRAPRRVLLDTTYPVTALPVGYGGRVDLVVGLPQWTVLRPRERVAAVTLALAVPGVAGGGAAGRLVRLADDMLTAGRSLLEPPGAVRGDLVAAAYSVNNPIAVTELEVNRVGRGVVKNVGVAGMTTVAAPLRMAQGALHRLWRPVIVAAAQDADARAAALAGRDAVAGVLLSTVGPPLGLTAAASAARYGRDPFQALAEVRRPERSEYTARLAAEGGTTAGTGLSTARRLEAVERATPTAGIAVDSGLAARADADVVRLRAQLVPRLTDELRAQG